MYNPKIGYKSYTQTSKGFEIPFRYLICKKRLIKLVRKCCLLDGQDVRFTPTFGYTGSISLFLFMYLLLRSKILHILFSVQDIYVCSFPWVLASCCFQYVGIGAIGHGIGENHGISPPFILDDVARYKQCYFPSHYCFTDLI